jgi:hypothetical protein
MGRLLPIGRNAIEVNPDHAMCIVLETIDTDEATPMVFVHCPCHGAND